MEKIIATFRVVTPMFMSGADQSKAELRLPSIKGALRFWWRALAWQEYEGDVAKIHKEEAELFGSADQAIGQAKVLMKLSFDKKPTSINVKNTLEDNGNIIGVGARYLGYGVMESFASNTKGTKAGELTRPCLEAPFTFSLHLALKKNIDAKGKTLLVNALKLMGLIGGIGSKSRKGYGSLQLEKIQHNDAVTYNSPQRLDDLRGEITSLLATVSDDLPSYTALSSQTRFLIVQGRRNQTQLSLLNQIGKELMFYRSYGRKKDGDSIHKVLDRESEKNFQEDHDLMKRHNKAAIDYPKRVAFGLPHNYGKAEELHVEPENYGRRASPIFIKLYDCGEGFPVAIISFIPAQFLPDDEKLKLLGRKVSVTQDAALWKPIEDFWERLKGKSSQKPLERVENFQEVIEVRRASDA